MRMLPSGSSQLPGGRHEGVAVKMRVSTLGSPRRPVASAPAPGAVPESARFSEHGPPEMFIFARFYKVFRDVLGHRENVDFPMVFHRFRGCPYGSAHFPIGIANSCRYIHQNTHPISPGGASRRRKYKGFPMFPYVFAVFLLSS